ncbi:hypothetical protein NP233_g996 [Leucocoprinus birnbaumii]|uniref:Rhodopsin domain-containing protein n=1 Tax=Leucocoprinus birnbaumii TaxID=56174 RepID=A0AAD5YZW9_9AGAR|nr:hypothetical protein NP233_g996 [Leucocoprinus birnbaumii]
MFQLGHSPACTGIPRSSPSPGPTSYIAPSYAQPPYPSRLCTPPHMSDWDALRSSTVLLHCLGNIASVTRLIYRARTRRLWWDDFWAFIAMLSDLMMLATFFGTRSVIEHDARMSKTFQTVILFTYTSVLWGARMSMAVTIVRLLPPGRGHCVAKGAAVVFALTWCGLLVEKVYTCQSKLDAPGHWSCALPTNTGILELCTDLAADMWLICSPAFLLWGMKLTSRRQIVIFSVFGSDVLLVAASVVHDVYHLQQNLVAARITLFVEVAISLIVCNLLVLVTWLYSRIFPSDQENVPTSINYPSTISLSRRLRHPNAPIYGFDGSVLVLTQVSSTSITTSFLDNQSTASTFGRPAFKPRTHSLNTLYPTLILPTYVRPTRSCPPLFYSTPTALDEELGDKDIEWNNVPFEPRPLKRPPSLVFSFYSKSWDPTDTQTYGARASPHRNAPPSRKIT